MDTFWTPENCHYIDLREHRFVTKFMRGIGGQITMPLFYSLSHIKRNQEFPERS